MKDEDVSFQEIKEYHITRTVMADRTEIEIDLPDLRIPVKILLPGTADFGRHNSKETIAFMLKLYGIY